MAISTTAIMGAATGVIQSSTPNIRALADCSTSNSAAASSTMPAAPSRGMTSAAAPATSRVMRETVSSACQGT